MTDPNTNWAQPEGGSSGPAPVAPVPPVTPTPVVKPKGKSGGLTDALLVVAALVAVGGITFAIGRATAPASAASAVTSGSGRLGVGPGGSFDPGTLPAGAGAGGFGDRTMTVRGTVKSLDGATLVITTSGGTETTVDVSESTYHAQSPATAADVTAGTEVSVSVTGFGGMRRPGASAAPDSGAGPGSGSITATDVTVTSR
jgi:hypothetical protein